MSEKLEMSLYHQLQQIYVLLDDGDRRALRGIDLTPTQYNLLQHLGSDVSKGHTISELADKLLCTRGNTTRLVRRLEELNLVQRGEDKYDRRLVRIALTDVGEARLSEAKEAHEDSVARRFHALTPQQQDVLDKLTHSLVQDLSADLANF